MTFPLSLADSPTLIYYSLIVLALEYFSVERVLLGPKIAERPQALNRVNTDDDANVVRFLRLKQVLVSFSGVSLYQKHVKLTDSAALQINSADPYSVKSH